MKKLIILIAILLIGLGVLVRGVEVLNGNYVFGFDHGREYLMTRDIVDFKDFRLIGTPLGAGSAGFQGIFHGPLYYYLLAIPYIIFSGDPYGGVVLMFLFGIGSLAIAYLLGRKLFGKRGGIALTVLLSLSPLLIAQSRFIWSPYPSTFFILLAFYSILRIKDGYKWVFFAAFFSALVYHFELAIAVPLVIALIMYVSLVLRIKQVKFYLTMVSGFVVAALPMLVFEVRHNFMAVRGIISYISNPSLKEKEVSFMSYQADHFNSFLLNFSESFPTKDLVPVILLIPFFIVCFASTYKGLKNKEVKKFINYLLILTFTTFLILTFLRNTVYHYYLYHLVIAYNIFFVSIVSSIISRAIIKNALKGLFALILLLTIIFAVPKLIGVFKYDINDYGGDAKIKGKVDAIDYIYNDAKGEKFGLLIFTPPVYTYPYDYILYWKGNRTYGYVPPKEKKKVTYLLIEVDHDKPWSYEGWLQTVIKDGVVEKEVKLPSGIIVQKRKY